jgi:hypothetical protein
MGYLVIENHLPLSVLVTALIHVKAVLSIDRLPSQAALLSNTMATARRSNNLKLVIEKYRPMIFGSKSEKLNGQLEQLEFRLDELETTQAATEAAQQHSTRTTTKSRSRASRKPSPEDLPREVITAACTHVLSGLWWCIASVRRGRIRAIGTHSGYL